MGDYQDAYHAHSIATPNSRKIEYSSHENDSLFPFILSPSTSTEPPSNGSYAGALGENSLRMRSMMPVDRTMSGKEDRPSSNFERTYDMVANGVGFWKR